MILIRGWKFHGKISQDEQKIYLLLFYSEPNNPNKNC